MSQIRMVIRFSQERKRAERRKERLISLAWCVGVVMAAWVFVCLQYYMESTVL